MRYLIDSDWLIDAGAGRRVAIDLVDDLLVDGAGASIITVAELYDGAFGSPDPDARLRQTRRFLDRLTIVPMSDAIAERFARFRFGLRRQGMLIPDMDLFIAATAVESDLLFVTRNTRHFTRIPDLKLY